MSERTITIIPATIKPKAQTATPVKPLRVAAYCRVSNPTDEQFGSLQAQVQHYTDFINSNPLWENADIFSEAVSGVNTQKRAEFKKLIVKCKRSNVDLILTKSISRLGRNTLDTVRALRELQLLNVDVYFEQENIHLLDENSRMRIELYCAMAQNESESKSKNIKWGIQRGFEAGTTGYANFACYGYCNDKAHRLVVEPQEAEIVRQIFDLRLQGYSLGKIVAILADKQILSPSGKST